ncbi:MAG: hypothetical protein E6K17_09320 [Methanobacteriota archaeon]|nr:MAG: hypothetical protein E6K17_09320 [Euryarchaeota archaeon]
MSPRPAKLGMAIAGPMIPWLARRAYRTPEGHGDTLERSTIECSACGACIPVCPAYLATNSEMVTGRGKLQVATRLLKGEPVSPEDAQSMFLCIHCGACDTTSSRGSWRNGSTSRRTGSRRSPGACRTARSTASSSGRGWSRPRSTRTKTGAWAPSPSPRRGGGSSDVPAVPHPDRPRSLAAALDPRERPAGPLPVPELRDVHRLVPVRRPRPEGRGHAVHGGARGPPVPRLLPVRCGVPGERPQPRAERRVHGGRERPLQARGPPDDRERGGGGEDPRDGCVLSRAVRRAGVRRDVDGHVRDRAAHAGRDPREGVHLHERGHRRAADVPRLPRGRGLDPAEGDPNPADPRRRKPRDPSRGDPRRDHPSREGPRDVLRDPRQVLGGCQPRGPRKRHRPACGRGGNRLREGGRSRVHVPPGRDGPSRAAARPPAFDPLPTSPPRRVRPRCGGHGPRGGRRPDPLLV